MVMVDANHADLEEKWSQEMPPGNASEKRRREIASGNHDGEWR